MNILSAENVYKSYGDKVLLDQVSFGIDDGERIGLIGVNGCGKSTFLKLVAGLEWSESGDIRLGGRVHVHYLPQEPVFASEATVLEAVFQGDTPVMRLLLQYEKTVEALVEFPNAPNLQKQLLRLQAELDQHGAWQLEHEAKNILTKLGIYDFAAIVGTLSGGQRKRVALARALIQPSDLLVLDEPTNHIDNETVLWLEAFLQKRKGALLMVTHDRYFLDRVVNRIFELDRGKLYRYPGNYHRFLEIKLEREAQLRASEDKRQNFLRNELEWIKRGPKARGTKQKARTDRFYDVLGQSADAGPEALEMSTASSRLGKTVIELEHVSKGYLGRQIIDDFSYIMLREDRIGIVGPNGSGKSTLLKLMANKLAPDQGHVVTGSTVKVGYFSQEHDEMSGDLRVIEFIREVAEYVETAEGETITASQMLERFLFPGPLQWTPITKLSGGEKRRLALLKTLMGAPNVLLLDEPTNDLDIPTLAVLESYLEDFGGAVVVVSHDRYFLDRVVEKVFAFEGEGRISKHVGHYSDYVLRRSAQPEGPLGSPGTRGSSSPASNSRDVESKVESGPKKAIPKFTFKEQREFEEIEAKITAAEELLADVNRQMAGVGGDHVRLQTLYAEQQILETRVSELMERWAYLSERAEEIEQSRRPKDAKA